MNIGFIGIGNMGGSLIRAIKNMNNVKIFGTNKTKDKLKKLAKETGLIPCENVHELTERSDFIVLAVKPQQAHEIWSEITPALTKEKCLISIAAGLTISDLQNNTHSACPVIRVMPNTPVFIKEGVTAVCFDDKTLFEHQRQLVKDIFQFVGDVHVLHENQLDVFTAVIGSGPAYIFYLIETMIDAAVELGLERDTSSVMVKKLFRGSSIMASQSKEHISILKEISTAPAGTTVAALAHFDRKAVRGNIMDAIRIAYVRSVEIGQNLHP